MSYAWRPAIVLVALAALGACTAVPSPVPAAQPARYQDDVLAFSYPTDWGRASYEVVSSFSTVLVYLSTEPLSDPCTRAPDLISCDQAAVAGLGPGGVLVTWSRQSFPRWTFDPTVGRSLVVGGRRATIEQLPTPTAGCAGIGGERELVATIDDPVPDANWTEMRACLRGPDAGSQMRQIRSMLESVTFER